MKLDKLIFTYFNGEVMAKYLPKIVEGFFLTIELAVAVVVAGIAAGLVLALIRSFRLRLINLFIVIFVDILRALPPLVIIIMFYFALPTVGIRMSGFTATWLSLSLVLTAFAEEIFWAGILAVPKGQWSPWARSSTRPRQGSRFPITPRPSPSGQSPI
jgi:polar amino acid transport system permease protein